MAERKAVEALMAQPPAPPPNEEEQALLELEAELGSLDIPAEQLTPDVQAQIDRMLEKIRWCNKYAADLRAVADARIADITQWLRTATLSTNHQAAYLTMVLEDLATRIPYPKGKTLSLPNGEIGVRAQQPSLEIVDKVDAVAFSKNHNIPIKEEAYVGKLKEHFLKTGEIPDGCVVETSKSDKPFVRVP